MVREGEEKENRKKREGTEREKRRNREGKRKEKKKVVANRTKTNI